MGAARRVEAPDLPATHKASLTQQSLLDNGGENTSAEPCPDPWRPSAVPRGGHGAPAHPQLPTPHRSLLGSFSFLHYTGEGLRSCGNHPDFVPAPR